MSNVPVQLDQLTRTFSGGPERVKPFIDVLRAAGLDDGLLGPTQTATPPERSSGEIMKDVFEIVADAGRGRGS